jgi:hypothetical protein
MENCIVVVAYAAAAMQAAAHRLAITRMSSLGRIVMRLLSHGVTNGVIAATPTAFATDAHPKASAPRPCSDINIGISASTAVMAVNVATLERYTRTRRLSAKAAR